MGRGRALSPGERARLVPSLRAHPAARVFLAWSGARAVGVAVCFLAFSTFRARPVLNVHDLAVAAAWRGRGIGRALLEHVRVEAERSGCCRLTLEVREDNVRARRLYARLGFAQAEGAPGVAMQRWQRELAVGD